MPDKADHNYIKNVYQVAIDKFLEEMNLIDGLYGTYVKITHMDHTTRPLQVHGMTSKLIRRVREIEIDEIVLDGIMRAE